MLNMSVVKVEAEKINTVIIYHIFDILHDLRIPSMGYFGHLSHSTIPRLKYSRRLGV